jgi:hypothetical protein
VSIRSNFSGTLQVPVTGGPGDALNPLTMCAWVKIPQRLGGFGCVLGLQDSLFNSAPLFLLTNAGDGLFFSNTPGTNLPIVADPSRWCFIGCTWPNGRPATDAVAVGLDSDGLWTEAAGPCAGVNVPPTIFIGGQTIGGGGVTEDADVIYRGVHVWKEAKGVEFLRQQSGQLAPISEVNLWSTTYFYDLSIAQLGQSMVGRSWNTSAGTGWTTSADEPPRPSTRSEVWEIGA